jgi:hypothetical protein
MRRDFHGDVEIARRPAARAGVAVPRHRDPRAGLDP